jgi:hypothetical protein
MPEKFLFRRRCVQEIPLGESAWVSVLAVVVDGQGLAYLARQGMLAESHVNLMSVLATRLPDGFRLTIYSAVKFPQVDVSLDSTKYLPVEEVIDRVGETPTSSGKA